MKKLVALLLALVMVLSLCTVAFAKQSTVADVIATNPDFPESYDEGWANKNANVWRVYYFDGYLIVGNSSESGDSDDESFDVSMTTVSKEGDKYNATITSSRDNQKTYTMTFNMADGKLTDIVISGLDVFAMNGTYAPAIEEDDDDTHCNLLPLIGTYLAVKAVGKAIKTAVVMPYVVHAVKWVVPAALAALRFGAMSRAMWHLR